LALDYNPSGEQFALVARVFVHYPCGDRFITFEARPRIEMCALTAAVEVSIALWARAVDVDARRSLCSARGALRPLAKCYHAWRARALAMIIL
jgi:hypothetical protein